MSERGDQIRRLDEAQSRLQHQEYGMIVLTSGPTPMSINDALGILLEELRKDHEAMIADPGSNRAAWDLHNEAHSSTGYLLRLDFGHGEREDNPKLYDALATLRMVVG